MSQRINFAGRDAVKVTPSRISGLDASRGMAMLFVCLAHFIYVYFAAPGAPDPGVLVAMTLVASPTFMLISGAMLGFLYEHRRSEFAALGRGLQSRGVFLLTAGHLLIVISCIPRMGLEAAVSRGFITDVIGFAIIVGPWLIPRLSTATRLGTAAVLFALAMLLGWGWDPSSPALDAVDFVLAGPDRGDVHPNFPLLPWTALYLLGTIAGTRLGTLLRAGNASRAEFELLLCATGAIGIAVGVKASYLLSRNFGILPPGETTWYFTTSIFQKFPPSVPYQLFFGGFGLLVTAAVLHIARKDYAPRAIGALAILGRASLFVFLLQFYVYYSALHLLALPYSAWWPLLFVATLFVIWGAAAAWLAYDLNRVFDLRRWFARRPELPAVARLHPMPQPPTPAPPANSNP